MEYLIPDWISKTGGLNLDALLNDAGTSLKLTILSKCPEFVTSSAGSVPGTEKVAHITSVTSLATLLSNPAWTNMAENTLFTDHNWFDLNQATVDVASQDRDGGGAPVAQNVRQVTITDNNFLYWPKVSPGIATGFILSIVSSGTMAAHNGKIVMIFRTDAPVYLPGTDVELCTHISALTHFFSYEESNHVDNANGWHVAMGDIGIIVPTVDWETARCAHVWIDPQRVNYVINPTFYNGGYGWRSNGTMLGQSGGIQRPFGLNSCLKVTPTVGASSAVLESNLFPTNSATDHWSVSAQVSGVGQFRVGIVFFQPSMAEADAAYLATPWQTLAVGSAKHSDFYRLHQSFPKPETTKEGLVRIEFRSATPNVPFWVDEVLAAPEVGPGTYFDSSWPLGQYGDYSWYGGPYEHLSYSLFYNNRLNMQALIFGEPVPGPEGLLNRQSGEAQKWVPEGINIVAHWDDVFSARVHTWLDDVINPPSDFYPAYKNVVTTIT